MTVSIDISTLFCYLGSTSNLALSSRDFYRKVVSNGFPIRTSKGKLCLKNLSFYKSLNYPGADQWTKRQIYKAIDTGNAERLKLLSEKGANIEAENETGETTLLVATCKGQTECLKTLLDYKANIEAKDYYKGTALGLAARLGRVDCLRLLLERGADLEAQDDNEYTALIEAARWDSTDCLKILLEYGAQVDPGLWEKYPQYAKIWEEFSL